ncbi:hypothetical protein MTO96_002218 [Rhipicephalus appendiculatus]
MNSSTQLTTGSDRLGEAPLEESRGQGIRRSARQDARSADTPASPTCSSLLMFGAAQLFRCARRGASRRALRDEGALARAGVLLAESSEA